MGGPILVPTTGSVVAISASEPPVHDWSGGAETESDATECSFNRAILRHIFAGIIRMRNHKVLFNYLYFQVWSGCYAASDSPTTLQSQREKTSTACIGA